MTETATGTRAVVVEREIPHPPERIWRALTQSQLLEDWLMSNDFRAEAGHSFSLTAAWGTVEGQVQAVEPLQRLSYTWDTKDLRSTVTWTLTPTATGTLLRMEQAGFRPDQEPYYRGAIAGWQRFMTRLEEVLARLD
jgi:uncharacterized protein YndB with AHSA1/START domain